MLMSVSAFMRGTNEAEGKARHVTGTGPNTWEMYVISLLQ